MRYPSFGRFFFSPTKRETYVHLSCKCSVQMLGAFLMHNQAVAGLLAAHVGTAVHFHAHTVSRLEH